MKIMLILAASKNDPLRKTDPFMPLSLPLLAGAAPEHDYIFVDMLAGEVPDFNLKVDVVGISARITAESLAYGIADNFRSGGVKVILGGAQVSAVPHRALNHADAVAVGEGEPLWPLILADMEKGRLKDFYVSVPGSFDAKGKSFYQLSSYPDLKNVPKAARQYYRKKYEFDTVFATRGCPINCDFCSVSSLFGKVIRKRPVEDVVKEIDGFRNFYYLLDDTVFGRPADYDYYLELYSAIARQKKKRFWTGQANLDAASSPKGREVIKKAAEAGFLYAAIGIESINPDIQKKSGTIAKSGASHSDDVIGKMKENIRFIQEQGIVISGWFTIGYDEDSIDTYYKTLEFCNQTNIIPVISPLEALPGTRLYDEMKAQNRIDHSKIINIIHPVMKEEDVLKAFRDVNSKGNTLGRIIKRTLFYAALFEKNTRNINDKIHYKIFKTVFTFILQLKLRKGIVGFANTGSISKITEE